MDAAAIQELFKGLSILAGVIVGGVVCYFALRVGDP